MNPLKNLNKISLYDCRVFGVAFCCFGIGGFFFFLSIAFLVTVKVAERCEYPVITRKKEKTKTNSVFNNVLLAQGKKLD